MGRAVFCCCGGADALEQGWVLAIDKKDNDMASGGPGV